MKIRVFMLFAFILLADGLIAQTLKGKIVDGNNHPVSQAAIYIRERMVGIATDDRGEFQTTLPKGDYTLEISSLGFEKRIHNITIENDLTTVNIQMEPKIYTLTEVVVTNKKEDPAYAIMRKAIARAPYHLHQVKSSQFDAYSKESIKINKVPKLIGNMKIDQTGVRIQDYSNKLYLVEAHKEITYSAPNKYDIRTIAISSTAPKDLYDGESSGMLPTVNIYAPEINEWVSPLAPDALTYYHFKLEDISQEGALWVNKIKVIPKKKNNSLASGWITIADDTWQVVHLDLTGTMFGVSQHVIVNYHEVKPSVFLPTSYDINTDIKVMGIAMDVKQYSSIHYKQVELDERMRSVSGVMLSGQDVILQAPEAAPKELTPKQQKVQMQLEELSTKENLNNRDAYKLAKLMQDAVEPEDTIPGRKPLEIKEITTDITKSIDSLAKRRDSTYWSSVRDLPLHEEEIQSYHRSANEPEPKSAVSDQITASIKIGGDKGGYLFGRYIGLGEKVRMRYSGLMGIVPEYNFVDGFWIGQRLSLEIRDSARVPIITLTPSAYYVTARRTVNWNMEALYRYAPMRNGTLTIAGGDKTADFNGVSGNSRIINALASILIAENRMKFYRRQYVEMGNSIDLANGLALRTNFSYEKRNALENNMSFSFFGKNPYMNLPNRMPELEPAHTASTVSMQLIYTPRYYYQIERGRKRYVKSAFPTFDVYYRQAIPVIGGDNAASYHLLEAGIRQKIDLNMFDNFYYYINAGQFLSSKQVYFPDYKHIQTSQIPVTNRLLLDNFSLLNDYAPSTDKRWLQAHVSYTSFYLFVKHLPFLQNYLFDEALHLHTLWTHRYDYVELGYSIGFSNAGRLGIFVGSNRWKHLDVGFSLSISLFN